MKVPVLMLMLVMVMGVEVVMEVVEVVLRMMTRVVVMRKKHDCCLWRRD